MGLWDNESYGPVAHRVCWSLVVLTTCESTFAIYPASQDHVCPLGLLGYAGGLGATTPSTRLRADENVTGVIILRFYARFTAKPGNIVGALGLDDALVGLSWIALIVTQIFIQIAAGFGNGKHYKDLSRNNQIEAMKWNTVIDAVIIWAFSLPKLAIVALLRRILNFGKLSRHTIARRCDISTDTQR